MRTRKRKIWRKRRRPTAKRLRLIERSEPPARLGRLFCPKKNIGSVESLSTAGGFDAGRFRRLFADCADLPELHQLTKGRDADEGTAIRAGKPGRDVQRSDALSGAGKNEDAIRVLKRRRDRSEESVRSAADAATDSGGTLPTAWAAVSHDRKFSSGGLYLRRTW